MEADVPTLFRRVMGQRADTVHLITYRGADGEVEGMTATAVTSLSLSPPTILVCINHGARARDAIRSTRALGVSVLGALHREIAEAAGRTGGNKSVGALGPESDPALTPVLLDALGTLQCRVLEERDVFTHTVFVAEVLVARQGVPGDPLLHHRGGYVTVAPVTSR